MPNPVPSPEVPARPLLAVGGRAPRLQVEHWLTDGMGRLPVDTVFEPGRVYVVEFWSTTCGPCFQTIPHLADLQTKYQSSGVRVIGITTEPPELVKPFLEREIQRSDGRTFRLGDVAKAYNLGSDTDGSVDTDYMMASGQIAIPVAFVVGKQGLIEWIGPPLDLDGPLAAAVAEQ
ncbi:thiol-disulfide oxidoreductase [Pirellula sp. SH-Sr6A]|uniref:peroxiredoxin family protein n=1 Tax=Pirellula sp. SH-Sr6A TaxID=1632865 RepID=UPI00078E636E|nr:TlpA disulfide reductase family protein [Pirellula sp. SH-Sr6A]AMV31127.1 thiol-disulfide oxidoreductase [Pirellula sp. SH-Sr6A]